MSTQQLLMRVAPQRSLPSPWEDFSLRATCHGQPPLQEEHRWSGHSVGELGLPATCCLALPDTAYWQNVLFIEEGDYFISCQRSEFHWTMVYITSEDLGIQHSSVLPPTVSYLNFLFSDCIHWAKNTFCGFLAKYHPSQQTRNFLSTGEGKGEFLEKLNSASIPVFMRKEAGKTRGIKQL